jgi:hypothetical protein
LIIYFLRYKRQKAADETVVCLRLGIVLFSASSNWWPV